MHRVDSTTQRSRISGVFDYCVRDGETVGTCGLAVDHCVNRFLATAVATLRAGRLKRTWRVHHDDSIHPVRLIRLHEQRNDEDDIGCIGR